MTTHSEQNAVLFEYIDLRIRELTYNKRDGALKKLPPKRREMFRRQMNGRVFELRHIKSVISRHEEVPQINHMKGEWINRQKRGLV